MATVNDRNTVYEDNSDGSSTGSGNVILNDTGITNPKVTSVKVGGTTTTVPEGGFATIVGTYGTLTIYTNGNYTYVLNNLNSTVNSLAAGQSISEQSFQYFLNNTTTLKNNLNISIQGSNDVPVISPVIVTGSITEDGTTTANGSFNFSDADLTNTHTLSTTPGASSYLGTFTPTITNVSTGDGSGAVGWNFAVNNSALQFLAAGQILTQTYTVKVIDNDGGSANQVVTITLAGTNDVPVASAAVNAVAEDATTTGNVSASDDDAGEAATLTYALVNAAPTGLTFNADGSYSFDATSYDSLVAGEELELTIPFTASDATSTSAAANLVITVTGTNDVPVASAAVNAVAEDTTTTGNVSASDDDAGSGYIDLCTGKRSANRTDIQRRRQLQF